MTQKPSIPKGTRDFGPAEMAGRNYIFDTIKTVFRRYGYSPIETPAMENLSTLLGKYGEEGDKLLFKILNSGDAFKSIKEMPSETVQETGSNALALKVSEKGLRYDLTDIPVQEIPDTARMEGRQASKRPLPRVLSVRCGCHRYRLPAQ